MNNHKQKKMINWWIFGAVAGGIITLSAAVYYVISPNMAMLLIILPGLAGTFYCAYKYYNFGGSVFAGISEKGPVASSININAFCIYGEMINDKPHAVKVQFEEVVTEKRLGERWFFEDLNKWLYVIFNDIADEGKWKAFELPDSAYTDPARLSIQLNMGRVNELFQLEPSLFEQLKPWLMVAAITIIGFLIFLSGSE